MSAQSPTEGRAKEVFGRALDAHDRGELQEAVSLYRETIKADPGHVLAHNNLGMAYIELERFQDAEKEIREAIKLDTNAAEAYSNLGHVLRRQGKDEEAAQAYLRFLELAPDAEDAGKISAWIDRVLSKTAQSSPAPQPVAPKAPAPKPPAPKPPVPKPPAGRVQGPVEKPAAEGAGDFDFSSLAAGIEGGEAAGASRAPQPPRAGTLGALEEMLARADGLYEAQRYGEAIAEYRKAMELEPQALSARVGLASSLLKDGHGAEATTHLEEALKLAPEDAEVHYLLGHARRAVGDEAGAADCYERYLELWPQAEDAEKMRAWIGQVRGGAGGDVAPARPEPARGPWAAAPRPRTDEPDPELGRRLERARGSFGQERFDEAYEEVQRALQIDPEHGPALMLAGRLHFMRRDYTKATACLEKAVAAMPEEAEPLIYLAEAYEKRGAAEQASAIYQRALSLADPRQADAIGQKLAALKLKPRLTRAGMVRCGHCLRTFPQDQIKVVEGVPCCATCRQTLGKVESSDAQKMKQVAESMPKPAAPAPPERRGLLHSVGRLLAALAIFATLSCGALVALWHFRYIERWAPGANVRIEDRMVRLGLIPPKEKAASIGGPLAIDSTPPLLAVPGTKYVYKVRCARPKLAQATFALEKSPARMAVDPASGAITWDVPASASGEAVQQEVAVAVHLGERVARQEFKLRVGPPFDEFPATDKETGLDPGLRPVFACGDLDGDGMADVALAAGRYREGLIVIYLGESGKLAEKLRAPIEGAPARVLIADLDGDGAGEILAINWWKKDLEIYKYSGGGGSLKLVKSLEAPGAGGRIDAVAVGDLSWDGKPDVVALSGGGSAVTVYTGAGGGGFAVPKTLRIGAAGPAAGAEETFRLGLQDIDGDGRLDILIAPGRGAGFNLKVLRQDPAGEFLEPETISGRGEVVDTAFGRLGALSGGAVQMAGPDAPSPTVYLGQGSGGFRTKSLKTSDLKAPYSLAAGDIDGDGLDDVIVGGGDGAVNVFLQREEGEFCGPILQRLHGAGGQMAFARLDASGGSDLVVLDGLQRIASFCSK